MDDVLQNKELVFGQLGYNFMWKYSISNAIMASRPNHPFWMHVLTKIQENAAKDPEMDPNDMVGSGLLRKSFDSYMQNEQVRNERITLLESWRVFPYNWAQQRGLGGICSGQSDEFNATLCKNSTTSKHTSCITYWTHSWDENTPNSKIYSVDGLF
jgi:hypothetical protein